MIGIDGHGFVFCGDDEGASGQMVGFSEEASGALLDGGNGCFIEDVVFHACDGEVMGKVSLHLVTGDPFKMAASDDTGCEGKGGSIHQAVNQVGLPCQDHGEDGFGVLIELGEGVEFGKHLEPQEGGLINDQEHFQLFAVHQVEDLLADAPEHDGAGNAPHVHAQHMEQLPVKLQYGAGGCGDI